MSFTFRTAELSDILQILKIEELSFDEDIRESREVFLHRISFFSKGFLVFEDDKSKKLTGYICSELWGEVPSSKNDFIPGHDISSLHRKDGKVLFITSFAILPEYRGSGIGKELFSAALEYFSAFKIEKIVLIVNEKWHSAKKIYADFGFVEINSFENVFKNSGGDFSSGTVMRKILRPCK